MCLLSLRRTSYPAWTLDWLLPYFIKRNLQLVTQAIGSSDSLLFYLAASPTAHEPKLPWVPYRLFASCPFFLHAQGTIRQKEAVSSLISYRLKCGLPTNPEHPIVLGNKVGPKDPLVMCGGNVGIL